MKTAIVTPIRVGISSCLLGKNVRYDGGHKYNHYITDTLGRYFNYLPVCPEVECGMSTPREAMRLEGDPTNPRLMTHMTRNDMTDQMLSFSAVKVLELESVDLSGFIFKKDSPSSGLRMVNVFDSDGTPQSSGTGLFASAVINHFPLLPMEEDERFNDPVLRENFLERVFCYHRWKDFLLGKPGFSDLVGFHSRHKLLVMSHCTEIYQEMGSAVAHGSEEKKEALFIHYEKLLMSALLINATVNKNTNVLMHIMEYLKNELRPAEKSELLASIYQYHDMLVPLLVPLTLLKHYVIRYDKPYLKHQIYFAPFPTELMQNKQV